MDVVIKIIRTIDVGPRRVAVHRQSADLNPDIAVRKRVDVVLQIRGKLTGSNAADGIAGGKGPFLQAAQVTTVLAVNNGHSVRCRLVTERTGEAALCVFTVAELPFAAVKPERAERIALVQFLPVPGITVKRIIGSAAQLAPNLPQRQAVTRVQLRLGILAAEPGRERLISFIAAE